jgi:hypothetical protein
MMGSLTYYCEMMQEKAKATDAPLDCIYHRDGKWHTYRDIQNVDTRAQIDVLMAQYFPVKAR